jgi:hypothetical protein
MGTEGGSALRRTVLLLAVLTLMATMVFTSALSGVAQEEPPFEDVTPPSEDVTPPSEDVTPPFEDVTPPSEDAAPAEDASAQETPLCAPQWLQEWYPDWASSWWWFWWFQYCYTDTQGWYRVYDGWDWGPPM